MSQLSRFTFPRNLRASPLARLFRVSTDSLTDTGTLTDTGVVENPIVDTGALQGRLLYDKNGNIIGNTINNKRQFEYIYDAQNRMIQVNRYNDVTGKEVLITFTYDALGRRTSKKVANVIYEYVYSGNDAIEEIQSNVNPTSGVKVKKETREYIYGARGTDDIVSVRYSTYTRQNKQDILSTTGNYYYEKNHLGSIIRITSSTGAIVDEYSYTVFGRPYRKNLNGLYKPVTGSNDSPIGNTRLYTGREYDREVSLYYMRARYYDAGLGRFVSRDPIGTKDDINLYRYVANNPMKYVDRMGLDKILIILGVDKDGIIPVINSDKTIDSCTEGSTYVCQRYYTLMREFLNNGTDINNISVQVATDFSEFDTLINEKQRESIYVIAHGTPGEIDISKGVSSITSKDIKQDTQTENQSARLSQTELYILACETGKIGGIAEIIEDHYGFEATYAPDNYMWGNGDISSFEYHFYDGGFHLGQGPTIGKMNKFTSIN